MFLTDTPHLGGLKANLGPRPPWFKMDSCALQHHHGEGHAVSSPSGLSFPTHALRRLRKTLLQVQGQVGRQRAMSVLKPTGLPGDVGLGPTRKGSQHHSPCPPT